MKDAWGKEGDYALSLELLSTFVEKGLLSPEEGLEAQAMLRIQLEPPVSGLGRHTKETCNSVEGT